MKKILTKYSSVENLDNPLAKSFTDDASTAQMAKIKANTQKPFLDRPMVICRHHT